MFRHRDDLAGRESDHRDVVVAGPGSSLTIPGIVVTEIVRALAKYHNITRIEVDVDDDFMEGIHRAPSLTAFNDARSKDNVIRVQAPRSPRGRAQSFRQWIGSNVSTTIAYAWPGIDNSWIRNFIAASKSSGASTIVACASLPKPTSVPVASLAETFSHADRIYVGDRTDASALASALGSFGPVVEVNRALSLDGRESRPVGRQITAFLPRNGGRQLGTMLAAFDAFPEAWAPDYRLHVVMRYSGDTIPEMVAESYHSDYVRLISDDISSIDLQEMCESSSILSVVDPKTGSRAFATAVEAGVATVVAASSPVPEVGQGYAGGLFADLSRPASIHVALNHALRLEALHFPIPGEWDQFARRIVHIERPVVIEEALEDAPPLP